MSIPRARANGPKKSSFWDPLGQMLKLLHGMGAALPRGQNEAAGQASFWASVGQNMPAGQTSGSNKPCGEVQYWPSILRLLQVGLGLHMAATEEALVKFAAGAMKPGGMRSLEGRRSSGGPKVHPLSHARTMTGKRSQMSSALA
jgi:hypothetical protein